MKIIHYTEAEPKIFEGDAVSGVTGRIAIGRADGAPNFCMRVFEISPGGHTPEHAHEWEHEIFFHSGEGAIVCDGNSTAVSEGVIAFVPGNRVHQIRNTGSRMLVFACLVPSGAPEL